MKVIFVYSRIYFETLNKICGVECEEPKGIFEKVSEIQNKWDLEEKKILEKIHEITKIDWKRESIYAYILPHFPNYFPMGSFSDPLTIPLKLKINGKIFERDYTTLRDIVVHEILHTLLLEGDWNKKEFHNYFKENYPNAKRKTLIHIPIHAILKELYLILLGEDRLERVRKIIQKKNKQEEKAWEIVEKEGHKEIIKKVRG